MCGNRNPMRFTNKADVDAIKSRWHHLEWSATEEIRGLIYGECDPLALFTVLDWARGLLVVETITPEELEDLQHDAEVEEEMEKENILIEDTHLTLSDLF